MILDIIAGIVSGILGAMGFGGGGDGGMPLRRV